MLAGAGAGEVRAAEPPDEPVPWQRGTFVPQLALGLDYGSDLVTVGFGLGASYFFARGLSIGLTFHDTVLLYSDGLEASHPGLNRQIPTNAFQITPRLQWVLVQRHRFSPYLGVGVGPTFFNNDEGTYGHWLAGPGAYIGLTRALYLDLAVDFAGMFPVGRCNESFTYHTAAGDGIPLIEGFCSFGWGPRLGLVLAFGGRSRASPPPE